LQFGVGLGERQHGRVARRDGFDLGIGEFLAADIIGPAGGILHQPTVNPRNQDFLLFDTAARL